MRHGWYKIAFLTAFAFSLQSSASLLTKKMAYDELQKSGFKWSLTTTLNPENEAKLKSAESATNPQIQFAIRQYAAKINPVQFGGANSQTVDLVGFGTTAIELKWAIIDALTSMKVLEASSNLKIGQAQTKHYQNELTALMLIQYLNVQRLKKQLEVMDANISKSQTILHLVELKKSVGAGIPLEIARAKNLLKLDQLKKAGLETKYSHAKSELASSLGRDSFNYDLSLLEPTLIIPVESKQALERSSEQRSDLKAAIAGVEAAEEAVNKANHYFFPEIDLMSEVGTTQATVFGMPVSTVNGFIGIALSIPIDTGGFVTAKREEVSILKRKADINLHEMRATVSTQVSESLEQLKAAEEALSASAEYLDTAQTEFELAQKKYSSGSSNILDLISAHAGLVTANDTRIEQVYNYEAAKIGYYRALGDFSEYFSGLKE